VKKFVFVVGALVIGACAPDAADPNAHQRGDVTSNAPSKDDVIAPSGGSVRAPYQVKTSAEIATAISACFGDGVTTVAASMIQTEDNPSGFLAARQFTEGDDVVAGEASIIDGDPSVERTGVRNAALSLPILASLQDIGNVVGENCAAVAKTNAICNCATKESAHAMLTRCLPSMAPSKYAALEDSFAATCAKDPAVAISSLLASTAFGVR
jgi:hypothetical protein